MKQLFLVLIFSATQASASGRGVCVSTIDVTAISKAGQWPMIVEFIGKSNTGYCSRGAPKKGVKSTLKIDKNICEKSAPQMFAGDGQLIVDCKAYTEVIKTLKTGDSIAITQNCADSMGPKGMIGGCGLGPVPIHKNLSPK